jgi:hypothetical protein
LEKTGDLPEELAAAPQAVAVIVLTTIICCKWHEGGGIDVYGTALYSGIPISILTAIGWLFTCAGWNIHLLKA